jgi:sulfonate transport system ATP-binding protein
MSALWSPPELPLTTDVARTAEPLPEPASPPHRPAEAGAVLALQNVGKVYRYEGKPLEVLRDIQLSVTQSEFVAIVGASGCGKSTLLRLVAGLDTGFTGRVEWRGRPVQGPSLERGIVFQEHRLFPWLTVEQNVALAFEATRVSRHDRAQRVQKQLEVVGLAGFEKAYPHQISGGMSQRVAIARALVLRPQLLLLDEPFGALDALTRLKLQQELQRLWTVDRMTTLLVTHDVEEAVFLADRIVVMGARPGSIQQVLEVSLDRPRQRSSAAFQRVKEQVLSYFADAPAD